MKSLFEKLNITNYTFFSAVYYKEEKEKYQNESKQFLSTSLLRDSEKGCLLSHLLIMRDFINSDFDRIAIFEDDANTYLSKDQLLLEVEKAFQNFDPDFLFLGKLIDDCSNLIQVDNNLFKNTKAFGIHSYVINKKVANYLLNQAPFHVPIDVAIYDLILKNKEFDSMTFHPSLFYQDIYNLNSQIRDKIFYDQFNECFVDYSRYLLYGLNMDYLSENSKLFVILIIFFILFFVVLLIVYLNVDYKQIR